MEADQADHGALDLFAPLRRAPLRVAAKRSRFTELQKQDILRQRCRGARKGTSLISI
jgi:hypothetical protein